MTRALVKYVLLLASIPLFSGTCIGAPWRVRVTTPTSEAAEVASTLRTKIGSSSKYELTDDSEKSDFDVYVACSVLKIGGAPSGTSCYETIQYFPLTDRKIFLSVYLGSTSAGGQAEYISQALFALLVNTTTQESITKVMKYEAENIRQAAVAMQLVGCPQ